MKSNFKLYSSKLFVFLFFLSSVSCNKEGVTYKSIQVDAPFAMNLINEPVFPSREFSITNYGAVEGGKVNNTESISKAIAACNKAGGGRVVIPAGEWLTGPIHFKSNVNLFLEEGAVVRFTDNPEDYLPAVMTSWEGLECYNYSPLLYAFECVNIAITGKGKLMPHMELWKTWFSRPLNHLEALKELYTMASTDVPVEERQMADGEANLRPHLIHFNRCDNVLLDGFEIEESPFWTVHMYMVNGGVARNLKVKAHGHNNDGIDLEMTKNFLVEDCIFDQGDDAVVLKAGRNRDAWRLDTPTENIVIRNCTILKGHVLLGVGSEMSGGVRNVYMHDCSAPNNVHRLFFIKTNHRRGGFVENIYMDNIKTGSTLRVAEIDMDVLYQWRTLVPTYEERITRIRDIYITNIECESSNVIYDLRGDKRQPIENIELKNIHVGILVDSLSHVENVNKITTNNITYSEHDPSAHPELERYLDNK